MIGTMDEDDDTNASDADTANNIATVSAFPVLMHTLTVSNTILDDAFGPYNGTVGIFAYAGGGTVRFYIKANGYWWYRSLSDLST